MKNRKPTKKELEKMIGHKFGPDEKIRYIEDGITWVTDQSQKDEPISRYDICVLEHIWLYIEGNGMAFFDLETNTFKMGLDHDSVIEESGYRNTIPDLEWSIGKMITQDYLEGVFVINCEPPFSAVIPKEKSRELLSEIYYKMLEAVQKRIKEKNKSMPNK